MATHLRTRLSAHDCLCTSLHRWTDSQLLAGAPCFPVLLSHALIRRTTAHHFHNTWPVNEPQSTSKNEQRIKCTTIKTITIITSNLSGIPMGLLTYMLASSWMSGPSHTSLLCNDGTTKKTAKPIKPFIHWHCYWGITTSNTRFRQFAWQVCCMKSSFKIKVHDAPQPRKCRKPSYNLATMQVFQIHPCSVGTKIAPNTGWPPMLPLILKATCLITYARIYSLQHKAFNPPLPP